MGFGKRFTVEQLQPLAIRNPVGPVPVKPAARPVAKWRQAPAVAAPAQTERELQIACHSHFKYQCPTLCWVLADGREAGLGWMNKNDGNKHIVAASLDKAQGLTPGVPDWQLAVARRGYHGLLVEFKTDTGTTSAAQDRMHQALEAQSYLVVVCRSLEAFGKLLQWYLGPALYRCLW